MTLIASGRGNREIAAELGIAYDTVKAHIETIFERLGRPTAPTPWRPRSGRVS
ncbi:LuxR C-terminal-related transcriptional regulator [Micromonosporaceae bacterium Da 78-11]